MAGVTLIFKCHTLHFNGTAFSISSVKLHLTSDPFGQYNVNQLIVNVVISENFPSLCLMWMRNISLLLNE